MELSRTANKREAGSGITGINCARRNVCSARPGARHVGGRAVGESVVSGHPVDSSGKKAGFTPARLIPVVVLFAGLTAFFVLDLDEYVTLSALKENRQLLADWVHDAGFLAFIVYMAVYAVATAFSLPAGAIITIAGGFLFGPWLGGALTVIGATSGATVLFLAARYAFADLLRERAGAAIRKMEDGFRENALSYMLFLRLIPVFPFFIVNLVPAFLGVSLGTYVIGTVVGIIPGSLVYASLGDGFSAIVERGGEINLGLIFEPRFLFPIVGLGILALLPVVYKKLKGRQP